MLAQTILVLFTVVVLAITDGVTANEKPRTIKKVEQSYSKVVYSSTGKDSEIWFSFFQMYGFTSVRINSTVTTKDATKKADFRVIPIRFVEFNETIPVEASTSVWQFEGKQQFWSEITTELINVKIDKKATNIVRMNATLTEGTFKYTMNIYLSDRSCFYGSYNLDADAVYIVQNIQNFPYKYSNSTIAVEQLVASRDSGQVSSYLAFLDSPFLGSLIISPEAYDSKLGKLPVSTSDFNEVQFKTVTSDMARESNFEQVYVALGSNQQPSDVTFEEKFAVNLGSVKTDGTVTTSPTGSGNPDGGAEASGASPKAGSKPIMSLILIAFFFYFF